MLSEKITLRNLNKKKTKEFFFIVSLLLYPAINFAIFTVYLSFDSILMAFQSINPKTFEVSWVGFNNFKFIIEQFAEDSIYLLGLKNNLLDWILTVLIKTPLTFGCGFWVYKKCLGSGLYRTVTLIPSALSGFITGLMFKQFVYNMPHIMSSSFGIENFPHLMKDPDWVFFTTMFYSFWGGVGTSIIYYSNSMNGISHELVESMVLEGCNWWQEFRYLTLPMIMPMYTVSFIGMFSGILTDQGPLFLFWGYEAPREAYRLGYVMFQKTMKSGPAQYGIQTALKIMITCIMFPLTMLVKRILDKLNPMED